MPNKRKEPFRTLACSDCVHRVAELSSLCGKQHTGLERLAFINTLYCADFAAPQTKKAKRRPVMQD